MPTTSPTTARPKVCRSCGHAPCARNASSSERCAAKRRADYQARKREIAAQQAALLPETPEEAERRAELFELMRAYLARAR